ncbi:MAG: FMN-dependent NADH-azoreductase [Firmicutes bacterium]|nr:FMN-dependent NADH-azoreductase [Bacillota bacterium]
MRVMLVCGSLHQASGTRAALKVAAETIAASGVQADFYDLGENRFPLYDPDATSMPPAVQDFRERAMAADAFIFGTPEYHGAMSGALKNALDYIGSRYVRNKPVGLLACAGGGKGGVNALGNLRTVVRSVSGMAVSEQVVVDEEDFDPQMNLTNENRRMRIHVLALAVVRYVKLLEMEKAGV